MLGIGDKILGFTKLYFTEHNRAAKAGTLTFDNEYTEFTFHLLDKIVENYSAIGEMLKMSEKPGMAYLKNSVYILVRGNLSDVIIACWLFDNTNPTLDDVDTIKEKTEELRRDHIRFHVSQMQKLESLGLLSSEEKDFDLKLINSRYRYLLTDDVRSDLNWRKIKEATPIKRMLTNENKHIKPLVQAYKNYFILSKIEHTGEFTRMMLEKSYGGENPMDQFVESSIHIIECVIKAFVPIFFSNEEFLNSFAEFKITAFNQLNEN